MRNNNGASIRRLSGRSLKNNRMRNLFAVLAIALTGILFTAVFSLTGGFLQVVQEDTMREVGGRFHAGIKAATTEQYEKAASDPLVAKSSYTILIGMAENIIKRQAEIRFTPDESTLPDLFVMLEEGHFPVQKNEIIVDTYVFDELGLPCALGEKIPLQFSFMGETVEDEFVVCGFYQGDAIAHASELFVSESYWMGLKGDHTDEDFVRWKEMHPEDYGAGLLAGNFFFHNTYHLEDKIRTVIRNAGYEPETELAYGVNWAYMSSRADSADPVTLSVLFGAVLVILLTGYLIIYNIFQISVVSDIRFYGLLKTIGTTKKQIHRLIRRQAFRLSVIGIPIGLLIGFGAGKLLLPFMFGMTDSYEGIDISLKFDPWIFVFGAGFSAFTVYLSSRKPGRIAGSVSPIEAVRYVDADGIRGNCRWALRSTGGVRCMDAEGIRERADRKAAKGRKAERGWTERRKTGRENTERSRRKRQKDSGRFGVLSMALANLGRNGRTTVTVISAISLSIILLGTVVTAAGSFRLDDYLENRIAGDFVIGNIGVMSSASGSGDIEIAPAFLALADSQEGVEEKSEMWLRYRSFLKLDRQALERFKNLDEQGKLRRETFAAKELEKMLRGEKDFDGVCYAYSEELLSGLEVLSGTLDVERFRTGNYILLTQIMGKDRVPAEEHIYHPGDIVTVKSFGKDSDLQEIRDASGAVTDVVYDDLDEKEYEVMAIVRIPYSMDIHRYGANVCDAVLPLSEFDREDAYTDAFAVSYRVAEEKQEAFEAALSAYTEKDPEMGYVSKASLQKEFDDMVMIVAVIGIALAAVIALIGILNFTNAMITEVISRKREFAVLQSIGMTNSQLRKTLIFEGLCYVAASGAVSVVLGSLFAWAVLKAMNNVIWFFEYRFRILPFVILLPPLVLTAVLVPVFAWKSVGKRSIVERLREE